MHSVFCCLVYGVLFRDPKRVMEETVFIPYRVFLYVLGSSGHSSRCAEGQKGAWKERGRQRMRC